MRRLATFSQLHARQAVPGTWRPFRRQRAAGACTLAPIDLEWVLREMRKTGVTLQLVLSEYRDPGPLHPRTANQEKRGETGVFFRNVPDGVQPVRIAV